MLLSLLQITTTPTNSFRFYQGFIDCSVYNSLDFIIMQLYYAIVNIGQFFALSPLLVNQIDTYTDNKRIQTLAKLL